MFAAEARVEGVIRDDRFLVAPECAERDAPAEYRHPGELLQRRVGGGAVARQDFFPALQCELVLPAGHQPERMRKQPRGLLVRPPARSRQDSLNHSVAGRRSRRLLPDRRPAIEPRRLEQPLAIVGAPVARRFLVAREPCHSLQLRRAVEPREERREAREPLPGAAGAVAHQIPDIEEALGDLITRAGA